MIDGAVISLSDDGVCIFLCPGCQEYHGVWTGKPNGLTGAKWTWNGDRVKPTFSPSILTRFTKNPPGHPSTWTWSKGKESLADGAKEITCHSFVRAGMIQFLSDCTHALAGQTVPLKPDPLEGACDHKWVAQRMGGSPSDADSDEMVKFCEHCGVEYEGD